MDAKSENVRLPEASQTPYTPKRTKLDTLQGYNTNTTVLEHVLRFLPRVVLNVVHWLYGLHHRTVRPVDSPCTKFQLWAVWGGKTNEMYGEIDEIGGKGVICINRCFTRDAIPSQINSNRT